MKKGADRALPVKNLGGATISYRSPGDWCHVCGRRRFAMADIFYADNAEHRRGGGSPYLRICRDCLERALLAIDDDD